MTDSQKTIADLEHDLESALAHVRELESNGTLPAELRALLLLSPIDGTSVHISLRHRDHARQIRRTYGAHAFAQKDGAVWIVFEAPPAQAREGEQLPQHEERFERRPERDFGSRERRADPLDEFLRALADAENQPQLKFVSLKWFRDTYLLKMGFPWAEDPEIPRRILQDATDRSLILTDKVANPKQPMFPVTSIHLNREHPDVQRILGETRRGD